MRTENKVKTFIDQHKLLARGDPVLVAVSGGPDSVALLHVLCDLRGELGLQLEVAHLHHGIRGEEAHTDARFVANMANDLGLPFHLKEINLPQMKSKAGKGNLEGLARKERYRFFADVARERGIPKVATAHTQDDQAETFLMWMLRGAGRKGLGGISPIRLLGAADEIPSSRLAIIRPLLDVPKAEILEFLKKKRITYRLDRSNQDPAFLRNWIRLNLIPQLKERIDQNLPSRLAQQAELIRDEESFLEGLGQAELNKLRTSQGIDRHAFLTQERAMQRKILRLWVRENRGHLRGLDSDHVEQMTRLAAQGPPQGRLSIPGGWEMVKEYDTLRLTRRFSNSKRLCYSYELRIGTELNIHEAGFTIESRQLLPPFPKLPDNFMEALFDLVYLPTPLTVRNFRHGDRFQPLGMTGHKKVKELFIEKKVPLSLRATLPLLSTGDEVLWIPGYGRSEVGKITPETKAILHLKVVSIRN